MARYIEKIRVLVRMARIGAPPEAGFLALAPQSELHQGPETLLERLNADVQVLPFQPPGGEAVLMVMSPHIEWVDADEGVDARFVRPETNPPTREEDVQVRLASGGTFEGVLAFEMPDEFNRASDYLNGSERFFPLRMSSGTRLVNKQRVVDVRVRGSAPLSLPRAA